MRDDQIETVRRLHGELLRQGYISEQEDLALTALLSELHEMRELLEAANSVGFQNYFLTRISPETWVRHSDDEATNGVQSSSPVTLLLR